MWIPNVRSRLTHLAAAAALTVYAASSLAASPRPVVLELFTSNSCSSCPPAYRLLGELQSDDNPDVQLIRLDEHVDYWNQLSWVDQYSSHAYTARQQNYAQEVFGPNKVYTPQLVVDGSQEMVGSDGPRVSAAIAHANGPAVQPLTLSLNRRGNTATANVALTDHDTQAPGKLWLAVTEDGIVSHVGAGENGGRTLHEDGVVRYLQPVATLGTGTAGHYQQSVPLPHDSSGHDLHVVAFVQNTRDHRISAAASQPLQAE